MKKVHLPRKFTGILASLVLVSGGFGIIGLHNLGSSSAATTGCGSTYSDCDAEGSIDGCLLVNGATVIYGWATDPDAPQGPQPNVSVTVGSTTQQVATDVAGYRDQAVNAYLTANYPNQFHTGTYGFKASFGGLYKGTTYAISGKALNYGPGYSTNLRVNTGQSIDGMASFAGNTIPAACLNDVPAPAPAPSNPAPPATTHTTTHSTSTTKTTTAAPAAPPPAASADGTVAVGTTEAAISVPADGATSIHISYQTGTIAAVSTGDQAVTGDPVVIKLRHLTALTKYSYQIVRTNTAGTTTATAASFMTSGYQMLLTFVDTDKLPVSGVSVSLSGPHTASATSDKNGHISFKNLPAGTYQVTTSYKNNQTTISYSTDSLADSSTGDKPQVETLTDTLNVDLFTPTSTNPKKTAPSRLLPIIMAVVAVVIAVVTVILIRRRPSIQPAPAIAAPLQPAATIQSAAQNATPPSPITAAAPVYTPVPTAPSADGLPAHAGQSLRDMVLQSMREEAGRRRQQPPEGPAQ